ncbi:leader peptidase (prepilin peptidase)/N-methyltransferase [Aurantimicrobium minutum]|uniref:A24 family peptidase n=1 Tax=Aurantimicrobium minutum TaxID=708131 RepID=UPI002475FF76|nr:A24 family peptidase [Aurantimicrobium minutum]MDH6532531.1 leader peptidase (prepilin peptidase)/N-methyltransferase [Aurantimicrobium minutum]
MNVWQLFPLLYLAVVTIPLVVIDVRQHRLPNAWVVPGYAVLVVAWVGSLVSSGELPWVSIFSAAAYFGFLLVLAWFGGMGMGDVKLAGIVGGAAGLMGFEMTMLSVALAFLFGGIVSVVVLAVDRVRRRDKRTESGKKSHSQRRIAFGPFILLAFWVAVGLHVLA